MGIICLLLSLALLVIVVRSLLSFLPGAANSSFGILLEKITEPVLGPVRRVIRPIRVGNGALDLAPLAVGLAIIVVRGALC